MDVLFGIVFGFLLIRFLVTIINLLLSPKLQVIDTDYQDTVSILIPARNEAHNIAATIRCLQQQDYQHYELLILDDQSSDGTAAIVRSFMADDPRITLLSGKELPKGWLGKNWACHQLADQAKGNYLMFIDADVKVNSGLIQTVLHESKRQQLTLLSIFPDQVLATWGERIVVPIMHYLLLSMLPLRFVYLFKQESLAAANGQFMFFEADHYRKYQFHQAVKKKVTEDIEIVKVIKRNRLKASTYLGNRLIECRMYQSGREAIDGFSKNLLAGFGNMIGLVMFLFLIAFSYILLFFVLYAHLWLVLPIILATNVILAMLSNQPIWQTVLLHPLKLLILCWIAYLSIYRTIAKTNQWKGRNINIE